MGFRSNGHSQLTVKYDATLDPDVKYGKKHGRLDYKIIRRPGSMAFEKDVHAAVSRSHAENQIHARATKTVVHLRHLLFEMGLEEHCHDATVAEGDNTQAVNLLVGMEPIFWVLETYHCSESARQGKKLPPKTSRPLYMYKL
jgi:hypothetical protein